MHAAYVYVTWEAATRFSLRTVAPLPYANSSEASTNSLMPVMPRERVCVCVCARVCVFVYILRLTYITRLYICTHVIQHL